MWRELSSKPLLPVSRLVRLCHSWRFLAMTLKIFAVLDLPALRRVSGSNQNFLVFLVLIAAVWRSSSASGS